MGKGIGIEEHGKQKRREEKVGRWRCKDRA